MELHERIRYLRKEVLNLSQERFGEILGVKRDVIKNIELNLLARPEQKEPLLKLICKEFSISEEWLKTGEGQMYISTKESLVEQLANEYGLSDAAQKVIECYLDLDKSQRAVIDGFINSIAKSINEDKSPSVDRAIDDYHDTYKSRAVAFGSNPLEIQRTPEEAEEARRIIMEVREKNRKLREEKRRKK